MSFVVRLPTINFVVRFAVVEMLFLGKIANKLREHYFEFFSTVKQHAITVKVIISMEMSFRLFS